MCIAVLLEKVGWTLGCNIAVDCRWGIFDIDKGAGLPPRGASETRAT